MNQTIIEATLTHSPDACVIVRQSGEISSWNPSATQLFAYTHEEIVGLSIDTLVPPSYQREFRGHFEAAITGIVPERVELQCVSKGGVFIPVELSVLPIVEADNHIRALLLIIRDLTGHRQTLDQLRNTEFKLKAIIGSSPSALSLKTPQGVYVLANPNLQKIHALPEDGIVGKTDFDLYPTEAATAFRTNDELVLKSREKHAIEELVPVNGKMRIYMSHIFPIFDELGEIKFISRISLDITEKKQAEAEVFKLVQAIEQSPMSMLITDNQGKIEFVNNKFLEVSLYLPDEVIGKTPSILKSGQTPSETYTSLKQTLARGQVWKGEFINRRKDGSEYYDSAFISPIRQADGHITHYVAAQQDVTESKLTQRRLEESEERFKLAMQGSQDGLWDWDIQLDKVYFSPSWKSMLGYGEHELPSTFETWEKLLHPDDRHQTKEALLQAVHDKKRTQFSNTFRLIHKKGHWVYVISRGFIVRDEEGNPKRMVGTHLDRTEVEQLHHELEEAWLMAQSEANSNDTKSKFLAAVNREVRAPLDALTQFAHLIRDEAPEQTHIRRHAELMEQVTQSLLLTLDDLDDFAKIDAGILQLVKSPIDVNKVLEPLLEEARLGCIEKGVTFSYENKINCSAWVNADEKRLRQIVNNLISNAIKFTHIGKIAVKVGLNPSAFLGNETASSCMLELEVSDTGVGIAQDTLSKLFKPITQLNNDAANRFGGVGLGLTIVKSLLDLMGGSVQATSTLGMGTTMRVKIPLDLVNETIVAGKITEVSVTK